MKKNILFLTSLSVLLLFSALFTACGSDDESTEPKTSGDKITTVEMTFNFDATEDMLNYCDFVVTYNDGTGEKQETVTSTKWSKTLKSKLPATFTFKRKVTVKPDKLEALNAATTASYTRQHYYTYKLVDEAGTVRRIVDNKVTISPVTGSGDKIAENINKGKLDYTYFYGFDENGNLVSQVE